MVHSALELLRLQQSVCPHCRRRVWQVHFHPWIETGLGILALAAITLMLVPVGIMTWKACTNLLSDREPHSILFHPLEDWAQY